MIRKGIRPGIKFSFRQPDRGHGFLQMLPFRRSWAAIGILLVKEYLGRAVQKQMSAPYSRIIFMHLVLIFGGGLAMFLGEPTPVLIIVIVLKTWLDVKAHLKEHSKPPIPPNVPEG